MSIKPKLRFLPGMPAMCWGRADSPPRSLCALCHGALPAVPLMLWRSDGTNASLCDECVQKWIDFAVVEL
jgi:hypothetical protein